MLTKRSSWLNSVVPPAATSQRKLDAVLLLGEDMLDAGADFRFLALARHTASGIGMPGGFL